MSSLHSNELNTLSLLFTEDIYVLKKKSDVELGNLNEDAKVALPETAMPLEKPIAPSNPSPEAIQRTETEAGPKKSAEFAYIGENNKYILILFDDANHKEISPVHKETILKIMTAKGLELRDLALLNINLYPDTTITELKDFFSCSKLVLFGINPQRISLPSMSANKVENHYNVKMFSTFSIDEMINDVNKKKEFWSIMKDF